MERLVLSLAIIFLAASAAAAQPPSEPYVPGERGREALDKAGKIVTQPGRDLGVQKIEVPPLLISAAADPYDLTGLATCQSLSDEVARLSEVLGPDLDKPKPGEERRGGQIAEAGGKAVVNSLIPFRGLVREVSGAAPAQRQLNAAIDAGFARRGFLRGVSRGRNCKGG